MLRDRHTQKNSRADCIIRPHETNNSSSNQTNIRCTNESSIHDTMREAIIMCAQKLQTKVSLIYRTERTTTKWKRKTKKEENGYAQKYR